jgi:hypothetical protein
MAKLVWDQAGSREYETGVSKGVLYPGDPANPGQYLDGVAWNGLVSVSQSPSGAEPNPIYADNIKYLNLLSVEEFEASIEAFTYPDEFGVCDGSAELVGGVHAGQQVRVPFCLSYQTKVGNDLDPEAGYKIHIIYGALAAPTERAYETVNDSPEAMTFSWDITTTPVPITGHKASAHIEINSLEVEAAKPGAMAAVEALLYGDETGTPAVQTPDEIVAAIEAVV